MRITPLDVRKQEFRKAMRGLDGDEVYAFLSTVADEYDTTMERYLRYQDHLFATNQLQGYELKTYHRRKRQSLLWKLLLDDAVESFPAFPPASARSELKKRVSEATGTDAGLVEVEVDRVLELGALVPDSGPEGLRYRWAE